MGSAMALNLMKKGFEVSVYTRTKSNDFNSLFHRVRDGWKRSGDVRGAKTRITIVGYPKDVEEPVGENGIIGEGKKVRI